MELKLGDATADRLKTDFANAVGVPSAVTYKAGTESAWYSDGEKVNSVVPTGRASAGQLILGGRLGGASYETEAQYYSVRIYDRVLSAGELAANAQLDRIRFLDEPADQVPDLTVNGQALDESGTTELTVLFEDGSAELQVVSGELGTQELTLAVDDEECQLELVTRTALEAALERCSRRRSP